MIYRRFSKRQMIAMSWWNRPGLKERDGILCDGAVRSGKTLCLTVGFFLWSMASFEHQTFGICGKTVGALRRNVIEHLPAWLGPDFVIREHRSDNKLTVRWGGRQNTYYLFGGADESACRSIQGITLAGVLLDEAALLPRSFLEQACARCSVPGSKLWFNCNPEGPEHWFYTEWVCKCGQKNLLRLRFTMDDNPSLAQSVRDRYERMYTGLFYRRFVLGQWCKAEGLVYDFDRQKHVAKVLPEAGRYYISVDYGTMNPFSAGLWCVTGGRACRLKEFYYCGREEGQAMTDEAYYQALEELAGNSFQRFAFYTVEADMGSGWGVKQTESVALTDIPRASPIAATDANIGAVSTVTVTRRSTAYTHSVGFCFGALTGWLDADGSILEEEKKLTASSIPFAVPESFYAQLTDAPYGSCTLSCATYSGDTRIGQVQQANFRVTADPIACGPVVTGTVVDANEVTAALTGDPSKLIRYASTALCTISAEGRFGASIVKKTVNGAELTQDSMSTRQVETDQFRFEATDSRGYSAAASVPVELIPYIPLTLQAAAKRVNPTTDEVILTLKGNYYAGSFGAAENALTLSYTLGETTGELDAAIEGNTYTASVTLSGLDYRSSYGITVTAADQIHTLSGTVTVGKGLPVFDWGEKDFVFHVPVAMEAGFSAGGRDLLELVHPVGSMYMSGNDTDPKDLFGGVWEPVDNTLGLYLWKRTA